MIIDLERFLAEERPYWEELERLLDRVEADPGYRMDLAEVKRFHYLYQRTCTDVSKLGGLASEPELRQYLESLAARAYGEIHEVRRHRTRFAPVHWLFTTFPQTFRRRATAFYVATAVTLGGALFGAIAIEVDPDAKEVLIPFPHLRAHPSERVAREEAAEGDRLAGQKTTFSAVLMTHNTRVSVFVLALGITWGIGSLVLLFHNGVLLGAVAWDYIRAGETAFLLGWLLPHGAFEIPAILIAGQSGVLLGAALIGWRSRAGLKARLWEVGPDLTTLIFGVALMLAWAGIVEAFFSQYHEPHVPYTLKILFGIAELLILIVFLTWAGRQSGARGAVGAPRDSGA